MKVKRSFRVVTFLEGLLACIGFLAIITICYVGDREKTFGLMETSVKGIANGISFFFTDATVVASVAATLNSARNLDWEVAGQDFTGFIRAIPYIRRISLVDSSAFIYDTYETGPFGNPWQEGRRTLDNSVPDSQPVRVFDRDYYRTLIEENARGEFFVVINEPFVPTGLTEKAFVTSAPIIRGGRAIGTVSVAQTALELSMLYESLASGFLGKFGNEAHMYLVSYEGQLVSDLEYREDYGAYTDELFARGEIVSVLDELGEDTVSVIDRAVRNGGRVISAKIDGVSCLVAGVAIEGTPFAACLAAPRNYMLRTSRAVFAVSFILFALSWIMMFFRLRALKKSGITWKDGGDKDDKPSKEKRGAKIRRSRFEEGAAPPDLPPDIL